MCTAVRAVYVCVHAPQLLLEQHPALHPAGSAACPAAAALTRASAPRPLRVLSKPPCLPRPMVHHLHAPPCRRDLLPWPPPNRLCDAPKGGRCPLVPVPGAWCPTMWLVPGAHCHAARGRPALARPRHLPAGALWSLNLELEGGCSRRGTGNMEGGDRRHRRDRQVQAWQTWGTGRQEDTRGCWGRRSGRLSPEGTKTTAVAVLPPVTPEEGPRHQPPWGLASGAPIPGHPGRACPPPGSHSPPSGCPGAA